MKRGKLKPNCMGKLQISFTDKQFKMLDNEKKRTGLSVASIVRIAIMDYFDKKP